MAEAEQLIKESASVPEVPKTLPIMYKPVRLKKNDGIKEAAIAIINDTMRDQKLKNAKLMKKVHKSMIPARAVYEAFQNFESALGGREALIRTLEHCPPNSNGDALIQKLLNDPDFLEYARTTNNTDNVKYSLAVICHRHRIPFNAIVVAFRDAKTAQMAVESLTTISQHAPTVVEQLAQDSQNRYDPCTTCEGTGRIWRIGEDGEWAFDPDTKEHLTQICHGGCRGSGKIYVKHDIQNRKAFLQMAGILEKDGKGNVNVYNQQAQVFKGGFMPGDGSFEKLLKVVDVAAGVYKTGDIIDIVPNTVYEDENEGSIPTNSD